MTSCQHLYHLPLLSTIELTYVRRCSSRNNLYPIGKKERTVIIFGQPGSGKTTLLYLLQSGEVVTTIPSFGFNIETIQAPTTSEQPLTLTGWDIGFGCQPIDRAITGQRDALMWRIDVSETDNVWFAESATVLAQALDALDSECQLKEVKKDFPILVLANKQDCPNVLPFYRIHDRFGAILSGRSSCIFVTSLTTRMDKSGLPEAFEWLRCALENASVGMVTPAAKSIPRPLPNLREASLLKKKIESWSLTRLTRPGEDTIFEGIEKYINESPQARARAYHVTMTYFWTQIVHLGIRNILPWTDLKTTETTLSSNISGMESPDQFALFLVLNPYVADENLWADYYSKEVMMSPAAKEGMVLPDKKPLPNLVTRDGISS
ncbi:hypothetical protein C0995_015710 [Termitomyces sp. Mi166|nr:hypothetical protein C0995_015710 [Termitomyces sp. Mi166\